jgi:predicted dehydrogenase
VLAGVWARRSAAAEELASANRTAAFTSFGELLRHCDAVAFAVPPDVQAELAVEAARAGRAVLLEKPIALDLDAAERLAHELDIAGVPSMVALTWRYARPVRDFLDTVAAVEPIGGRGRFISGALLGGQFATPWRLEHGPLLDLGPHVIDLLDAALGEVVRVRAHGDPRRWVGLLLDHASGAASEATLSAHVAVEPSRAGVEVYTTAGAVDVDTASAIGPETWTTLVSEFAAAASGGQPHPLDVHRGVHLQRVIGRALDDLRRG